MRNRLNLIVMLTHNDKTVNNAYEIFDRCRDSKALFWGFKEEPISFEESQKLYKYMKDCGKKTVLEVVRRQVEVVTGRSWDAGIIVQSIAEGFRVIPADLLHGTVAVLLKKGGIVPHHRPPLVLGDREFPQPEVLGKGHLALLLIIESAPFLLLAAHREIARRNLLHLQSHISRQGDDSAFQFHRNRRFKCGVRLTGGIPCQNHQ